jgi:ribosomal protein L28
MFGRGWQEATGVVLDSRVKSAKVSEQSGSTVTREFVVAVTTSDGATRTVTVPEGNYSDFWAPRVGQSVKIEVSAKGTKVRFDRSDLGLSFAEHERLKRAAFDGKID